jgi:cell division protein FtsI (penicillin-binding protein 3)
LYYGADVAGPVFKRIAQKIFTDVPSTNEVKKLNRKILNQEQSYAAYYDKVQKKDNIVPNVKGMTGMDAVALLENFGLKVKIKGIGKVKQQSILPGQVFTKNQVITLELS